MGRGNWMPNRPWDTDYNLVYVEVVDSSDADEIDDAYYWLKENIEDILPKSFRRIGREERLHWYSHGDSACIFANGLFMVVIDTQGDHWHHGIALIVREDAPAFAPALLDQVAEKLWLGLHNLGYKLSRRACAWTSTPYTPKAA